MTPDLQIIAQVTGQSPDRVAASTAAYAMGRLLICDGLTGLYNRRYLQLRLFMELERARPAATPVAVLVVDLNGFKEVNDRHGHAAGDQLLHLAARALAEGMPSGGVAARYGGDEFVVVLPGWPAVDAQGWAEQAAERMARASTSAADGQVLRVTASIGLAVFPDDGGSDSELFAAADQAMYNAKHRQGGGVVRSGQKGRLGRAAPLAGRQPEQRQLAAAMRSGRNWVFGISGGPGLGKSRFLQQAVQLAGTSEWCAVLSGDWDPAPLGSLRQLADRLLNHAGARPALLTALLSLPPADRMRVEAIRPPGDAPGVGDQDLSGPVADPVQVAVAVGSWLRTAATSTRLLVAVDDFHLWDAPSQELARVLPSLDAGQGLIVIFTYDAAAAVGPAAAQAITMLQPMSEAGLPVTLLDLKPLAMADIAELVSATLAGSVAPDVIREVETRSGGNPLAVNALLETWLKQGGLVNTGTEWRLADTTVSAAGEPFEAGDAAVSGAVSASLDAMSRDGWHLLQALAVSDRPWRQESIGRLVGMRVTELAPLLAEGERHGVLAERNGEWQFTHGVLRGLVRTRTGPMPLRAWHRLAVAVRSNEGTAGAGELGLHWEKAGDLDQAIASYRTAAVRAASVCAPMVEGQYLRKAAELAQTAGAFPGEAVRELWEQAGKAFQRAGRCADAYPCLERALSADMDPQRAAEVLRVMACACISETRWSDAGRSVAQGLEVLKEQPVTEVELRLKGLKAWLMSYVEGRQTEAAAVGEAMVAAARAAGWPDLEAHGWVAVNDAFRYLGRYRRAAAAAASAAAIPGVSAKTLDSILITQVRACPNSQRQVARLREVAAQAAQRGDGFLQLGTNHLLFSALVAAARWEEAEAMYHKLLPSFWQSGSLRRVTDHMATWGLALFHCGRQQEARTLYARISGWPDAWHWDLTTELGATLLLADGQPDRAVALVTANLDGHWPSYPGACSLYLTGAEAWLGCGDVATAGAWVQHARRCGTSADMLPLTGWLNRVAGQVTAAAGDTDRALEYLARTHRGPMLPRDRIAGRLAEAALLLKLGRETPRATHLVQKAAASARRLNFAPLATAAANLLAAVGAPRRPARASVPRHGQNEGHPGRLRTAAPEGMPVP